MRYAPATAITSEHLTDEFDCGSDAQMQWLRRHALQAHQGGTSRVRVVTLAGERTVVGYYALAAGSVVRDEAPVRVSKGTARYPVPVVILTRLGVDLSQQGQGLGSALVKDALVRVVSAAEEVGVRALLIHCENEQARAFYQRLGEFEASPTDPLHLYLLLSDLRRTVA